MCGKVIVTVKASQESFLIADIRDYLFLSDRSVSVKSTGFRGVLLIESSLDPKELSLLLINSPIPSTVMSTVVPILTEGHLTSMSDIVNTILPLLKGAPCTTFIVRCRLRESPISDGECESGLRELIRTMGFRVIARGEGDCVVYVQGIRDWFGVYVGSRAFVRV
ncbi:hypothetical protein [Vulcanisaeta thermophila]|uniref:hypothetical protein n=1 Tax=Vulcanisaeta thermophila TaxID=867917 RepID=UPI000853EA6E|nr:hypothetical protein [Vulcanisaeta thermophila]